MAHFRYQAKDSQGKLIKGVVEANSAQAAADQLLARQSVPIKIDETQVVKSADNKPLMAWLQPKVGLDEMIIFSRQMYSLLKAGIPIIRAINGLAETTTNPRFREVLKEITTQLEQGRNLSAAMASHKEVFHRLMISIVVVGENTGKLDDVFLQLALYFEREQETRKRIKSALRYPTFVLIALAIAMFILNLFVVPVFTQMFERFDTELPIMTRVLIGTSNFFVNYWWLLIIVIVGGIFAVKQYVNSTNGRLKWDKFKLKLPVVGSIIERIGASKAFSLSAKLREDGEDNFLYMSIIFLFNRSYRHSFSSKITFNSLIVPFCRKSSLIFGVKKKNIGSLNVFCCFHKSGVMG